MRTGTSTLLKSKNPSRIAWFRGANTVETSHRARSYPAQSCKPRNICSISTSGGVVGEADITNRQSPYLPNGFTLKITNPKAIVIAGRSNKLSVQQLFDFELIKRKY